MDRNPEPLPATVRQRLEFEQRVIHSSDLAKDLAEYATWLTASGDPFGGYIASRLSIDGNDPAEYVARKDTLVPVEPFWGDLWKQRSSIRIKQQAHGIPLDVEVRLVWKGRDVCRTVERSLLALSQAPLFRLVRKLRLTNLPPCDLEKVWHEMDRQGGWPSVQALVVSVNDVVNQKSARCGGIDLLLAAFPGVRELLVAQLDIDWSRSASGLDRLTAFRLWRTDFQRCDGFADLVRTGHSFKLKKLSLAARHYAGFYSTEQLEELLLHDGMGRVEVMDLSVSSSKAAMLLPWERHLPNLRRLRISGTAELPLELVVRELPRFLYLERFALSGFAYPLADVEPLFARFPYFQAPAILPNGDTWRDEREVGDFEHW